jgi:phospholipid transport system substrate-binding protein
MIQAARLLLLPAALLTVCAFASLARANGTTPTSFVQENSEKVLAVLNSSSDEDAKIRELQRLADQSIDFDTVSRLVLAKYWKQCTPDQQAQFTQEFKKALTLTYARRIGQYGREQIQVLGNRPEQLGDVTVQSKVVGGKVGELRLDYRLRQKEGVWYVIDISIEGVSLVSSYRSQFQEVIGQGGIEKLLAQLREKNQNGQGLQPIEAADKAKPGQ